MRLAANGNGCKCEVKFNNSIKPQQAEGVLNPICIKLVARSAVKQKSKQKKRAEIFPLSAMKF
ncbi:MAG: hypothetical protein AVDCRST_MAG74-718 [uncultured Pyrinomonadaceae bacterium]|uniref:Uncharacterized protein n=1 Tax=uncultured Pyrinomonadaceae bacterium TaxID=2283094 RepID=A0A6J4NIU8_9BACT|nr:MAG: hypothetical protein AVDCRST_MAG74-718 [uncultured Pyrinomonadaceae bacterium]